MPASPPDVLFVGDCSVGIVMDHTAQAVDVELEERALELQALEREAVHAEYWLWAQTLGGSALCSLCGSALMLWSFHSTDIDLAPVAFWGGLAGGYSGITVLLLRHALRAADA